MSFFKPFYDRMRAICTRIKIVGAKLVYGFALRHWVLWSRIYRLIYHSKYRGVVLDKDLPLTRVKHTLNMLEWKPDGLRELFDVCGTPNYVQHIVNVSRDEVYRQGPRIKIRSGQPDLPLDCDEFAVWAANVLERNFYPRLFIFSWITQSGELVSHVMCLCRQEDGRLFHIGNWGISAPFQDLRAMCLDIMSKTRASESIGWAILDKDLRLLKWGKELPSGSVN